MKLFTYIKLIPCVWKNQKDMMLSFSLFLNVNARLFVDGICHSVIKPGSDDSEKQLKCQNKKETIFEN